MVGACLVAPRFLTSLSAWEDIGPLLLFLCLLTLINAPFNWLWLGLTRALRHCGLERGGSYPSFFAILDAWLAVVVIGALSAAMVVATPAFNDTAEAAGGRPVLPLKELFDGIELHPGNPEYWWVGPLPRSLMRGRLRHWTCPPRRAARAAARVWPSWRHRQFG
jgi:hypothetical protein